MPEAPQPCGEGSIRRALTWRVGTIEVSVDASAVVDGVIWPGAATVNKTAVAPANSGFTRPIRSMCNMTSWRLFR
jgi:hypothetical protein